MQKILTALAWISLVGGVLDGFYVSAHMDVTLGSPDKIKHPQYFIAIAVAGILAWAILLALAKALDLLERNANQAKH